MRKLLAFDPTKKKLVLCGYVDKDSFIRNVSSEHFMRVVGGYGIQEIAFKELEKRKVKNVLLKETDTKKNWYSKLSDWMEHGRVADYGHGQQRFLSLNYMLLVQKGGEENGNKEKEK
jgi:hypothetical protein